MRFARVTALCFAAALLTSCHSNSSDTGKPSSGDQQKSQRDSDSGSGGQDTKGGKEQDKGSFPSDTVKIAREDQPRAGIQVVAVSVRTMPRTLNVSGQVAMNDRNTQHIGALADGRIESVFVLPGDAVRRGQTLATLHSHSVHETVAALTQAYADLSRQQSAVRFASQARDRYQKLYAIQAASLEEKQRSEQELAQAQKNLIDAEANVRAEREHLAELLQVDPATLQPGTLYRRELIPIRAVSDGVIIQREVTPGQVLNTGDEAFVVSNLTTVWVNAAVNEADVPMVRRGAFAAVKTGGATEQNLSATVGMLSDAVDPQTRTLPVRLVVPNPATRLRPGMFVTAMIAEPATRSAIFVPANALQDVNGFRVVFVTNDGVTFQARAVKPGTETEGMVEITEGLQANDHVVSGGAFMVKGELLKGSVGEG